MTENDWKTVQRYIQEGRPLTTFQVSKICGVVHSTVSNWIEGGKLTAYRTPGGHRRIHLKDLTVFLKLYEISLPPEIIKVLESKAGSAPEPQAPAARNKRRGTDKKRILVVEDDRNVSEILTEILRTHCPDCEVSIAFDGFQAGKQIALNPPDLVILDLILPGIDGFQIVRNLRQDPVTASIKIIAVTGFGTQENRKKLEEAGHVDALMTKPVDLMKLCETVVQLLRFDLALER